MEDPFNQKPGWSPEHSDASIGPEHGAAASWHDNAAMSNPRNPDDDDFALRPPPTSAAPRFTVRQRIRLTVEYHGVGSLLYRLITYLLRFTPLRDRVRRGPRRLRSRVAIAWYKRYGRPVTIVIPSFRDPHTSPTSSRACAGRPSPGWSASSLSDDAVGPEHLAALSAIEGIQVVEAAENSGFAANVNRGICGSRAGHDVVLLNSDIIARRGWLENLQYATSAGR